MWKQLPYSKPLFLSCTTENGYRINVTDYVNIWWVHHKENEFQSILKKSNDDLEMESDNELLQLGLKMLFEPEKLKKLQISFEEKDLNIAMLMSCGFPLYLELKLTEGSKEMFFKNITQQLLKTILDLKTSENELRCLLIKKDKEIEEYKTETDVRLAMYLKTGVFRDEEHMGKHPLYENYFGTVEVPKCILEKNIDEAEDQVMLKQEHIQIKEPKLKVEPDSQTPIKNEHHMPENDAQNLSNSGIVKNVIHDIVIPKKKLRKMLKI